MYVPVHTGSYWYILVHTSTYQYIPVHTYADQGSKKMQTGFEPEIFCILFACIPTALQEYRHQIPDMEQGNDCVYIMIVHIPACVSGS